MEIYCNYTKLVDIDKLIENPKNDNRHNPEQIELLAKLIKKNGIRHPIIVSESSGFIVAGHLRLLAAKKLGLKEYPVDFQKFETVAAEYSFLTSDNNIARYAELDKEKLILNLKELDIDLVDFDFETLGLIGFVPVDFKDIDLGPTTKEQPKKYEIKISFDNETDMTDIYDELISRKFAARIV